jgi:hypothetical protein
LTPRLLDFLAQEGQEPRPAWVAAGVSHGQHTLPL